MSLRPKLRSDLSLVEQRYRGETTYIVKDPASKKYFRFKPLEVLVMQQFTGDATTGEVADALGEQGADVVPVFITVDPRRDTPQVVGDFVARFDHRIAALTGSPERIAAAARAYRVYYDPGQDAPAAATGDDRRDTEVGGHGGGADLGGHAPGAHGGAGAAGGGADGEPQGRPEAGRQREGRAQAAAGDRAEVAPQALQDGPPLAKGDPGAGRV